MKAKIMDVVEMVHRLAIKHIYIPQSIRDAGWTVKMIDGRATLIQKKKKKKKK